MPTPLRFKGYYAGVGSTETPAEICEVLEELGRYLCDLGWGLSSGDAPGADRAFYAGAKRSVRFYEIPSRIYLPWNGSGRNGIKRWHDEKEYFLDAQRYQDTWETAKLMASTARGGFEGLGPGGIALHTRNVFQVHGHDLNTPVKHVVCWARQITKTRVAGGTNTAVQLALQNGIDVINLYTDEGMKRAESFIELMKASC